jgi:hypothetical protein
MHDVFHFGQTQAAASYSPKVMQKEQHNSCPQTDAHQHDKNLEQHTGEGPNLT